MKVLQIANGYATNTLYSKLFKEIANLNIDQFIYSPVRTAGEAENYPVFPENVSGYVSHVLNRSDRLFYRKKIQKTTRDIRTAASVNDVSVIHAHTLYSDGGIAYQLFRSESTPFVVSVRNTDINIFSKYRRDLACYRNKILVNAESIILLSPAYGKKLEQILPASVWDGIRDKLKIVPNGIDDFWFESTSREKIPSDVLKILFVGTLSGNKNVVRLMSAVKKISLEMPVSLSIVGGRGSDEKRVIRKIQSEHYPFVTFLGKITDPVQLRNIYRSHDVLAVVSHRETFGLVYIEALSQGLPIVYSQGQGVSGYFPVTDDVCEETNPRNPEEIAGSIKRIAARLSGLSEICTKRSAPFRWRPIAEVLSGIYVRAAKNI